MVQDVLTKGNHPRGIKVRLQDGKVGRVQRMGVAGLAENSAGVTTTTAIPSSSSRFTGRYTDVRLEEEEFPEGPPPRSLADYFPPEPETVSNSEGWEGQEGAGAGAGAAVVTVKCPFCEGFEGDEMAVSYHVDREHLG